jgi:restriction system protein
VARRRNQGTPAGCLLALVAAPVVLVAALVEGAVHGSAGAIVVLLLLAMGSAAGGYALVQRRRRAALEAARAREVAIARSYEIAAYHQLDPRQFEHALAFLCERDGCTGVRVVGGAGDLGADVVGITPDGRRLVIQAKRYGPTTKVTGPALQRFGGTCFSVHGANVAVVVTTSTFTRQARDYAHHMGIRLYDADALAGWASRTGPAPWHQ